MSDYTLITGASSGIGKELARFFAKQNHNILLVARRESRLQDLANELLENKGITILYFVCDLTQTIELNNLYAFIAEKKITISILINNAGIGDFTRFENSSLEKNKRLVDLNINSVLELCHYCIPQMIQRNEGKILNIASMAAFMPGPFIAVYAATKSFILNYSIALATELEDHNIQVSVLCPGDIKTEFQTNANLEKFEINSKISLPELAEFTYKQFIIEKECLIIPLETKKHIDMIARSGTPLIISRNLYKMRKMLAKKLGLN
jgi:uncharacterized protein